MYEEENVLVKAHLPCDNCGSHDALSEYSDGHTYCFSCGKYSKGDSSYRKGDRKMALPLIESNDYPVLTKRRLNEVTLRKFGYKCYYYLNEMWHIAPYYNSNGELVAQHLRGSNKQFKWTGDPKHLQFFGQHLWASGGKRVVITEGEIDCMTISQIQEHKWAVVSLPNGAANAEQSFKDNLEWLESFEKVIICFDNDDVGKKAAYQCAQILSPAKAFICTLPLKDASDMYQAGRGQDVIQCLWNAAEYRPEGIISGTELWESLIAEPEKGYDLPYPELNDATHGIRHGELWLITAGSGIGKSTIVHEIGYKLMMSDHLKIGVMALEESKRRTAERYLGIYLNKPLHINREGISEAKLREAFEKTVGQEPCVFELYDHFGSTAINNLISKIRYMFVGLNCDLVILDHITITLSGLDGNEISDGERRSIDILMTKLRSLVEETGKTVLAISHLKRPEAGKSWNEGKVVRLTDLRGSASLEQLSDVVVALSRDQSSKDKSDVSMISVLKNRPVGITGDVGYCKYYHDTGRLLPIKEGEQFFNSANTNAEISDEEAEEDF